MKNQESRNNPAKNRAALIQQSPLQSASGELSPNDHLNLMLEMCKPESLPLIRRWVAALMLIPESEREATILAVEKQIVAEYAQPTKAPAALED